MKANYITIHGVMFNLVNKLDADLGHTVDFYEAYKRPSYRKIRVWEDWSNWISRFEGWIGVASHCSTNFTIVGEVKDNNKTYIIKITKLNNYAQEVTV